ncbi:hypothetical protein [Neorhizobium galegae]|uniref:hypothetical protein n=1 Tax=Neorhizobium galegae TaxID=399 RepID=UPI001AE35458|nr:hypothetical protein [Neorhizobium galegae]
MSGSDKLLLHHVDDIHGRHDIGDVAMDLQGCRLVAGRFADHDSLDEITHDRHQAPLCMLVGIAAGEEDQREPASHTYIGTHPPLPGDQSKARGAPWPA